MTMPSRAPETTSRKRMIDALVDDKFAAFIAFECLKYHDSEIVYGRTSRGEEKYTEYIAESRKAKQRYTAHLHTLSHAELEEALHKLQVGTPRPSQHDGQFLNEPFADAEYDYWARQPMWSLEAATALLLGKDADVVDLLALRQFSNSAIKKKFDRLLYRLQDAKERRELTSSSSA